MTNSFVILHLSDSHIGKSGDGVDEDKVRKALLMDIETMHKEYNLTPNMVVFSGDIVQGCRDRCANHLCLDETASHETQCRLRKQYKVAETFLRSVAEKAGISFDGVPLVIVPGNHDINRHRVDFNQRQARGTYRVADVEELQKDDLSWRKTLHRQHEWAKFAREIAKADSVQWDTKFNVPFGVIKHDDIQIGFTGLNTSWAAFADRERHNLWLGKNQFDSLKAKLAHCTFTIAVSHHPCGWLHEDEEKEMEHSIASSFSIHLHGHEHNSWFKDEANHLTVEGGATYENSSQKNAYSWVEIDFKGRCGTIYAREYSNDGRSGWIPANIPGKIREGKASIRALFCSEDNMNPESKSNPSSRNRKPNRENFPGSAIELIHRFESNFCMRWERGSFPASTTDSPQVFWPVRLRRPTAIHASQSFVVAGLIRTGCCVNLFVDDLGLPEFENPQHFLQRLKLWIERAGGRFDDNLLRIRKYSEIAESHAKEKTSNLERLLQTEIYKADTILRIAKICTIDGRREDLSKEDLSKIVDDITKRRPRRLLTPAMTWTCLRALHDENRKNPIITLGGHDEKVLWKTWRDCFSPQLGAIGHLYISELSGVHLADNTFNWSSIEDIRREFRDAQATGDAFASENKMIPWCVNNCVLVPNFITLDEKKVRLDFPNTVHDLMKLPNPEQYTDRFVRTVDEWVL